MAFFRFALDLVSILVSAFDFLGLGRDSADVTALANLKVLRVLRVLRLAKLFRLIRASRIVKRWETRMTVNYAALALCRSIGMLIILAHWMACGARPTLARYSLVDQASHA